MGSFELALFPNPSAGKITIQMNQLAQAEPVSYELFSLTGQRIWKKEGGPSERIQVDSFSKGIYLLKIKGNSWLQVKQLVVD